MKFNSVLKIAAGAVLMTVFTTAMAQIRHFNVEGTLSAQTVGDGNLVTRNSILSALNGKSFSVSFDLDFSKLDTDSATDKGLYANSVSNTSAATGGFDFAPISNSCLNLALDCKVSVQNDQFGVGFDLYGINTGLVQSASFDTLVGTTVSINFFLSAGKIGLFDTTEMLGPNDFSTSDLSTFSGGAGANFVTSFGLGQQSEFGRANFGVNVTRVSESTSYIVPTTAVPEPETYAIMLAGLGLIGAVARRRKAKHTS